MTSLADFQLLNRQSMAWLVGLVLAVVVGFAGVLVSPLVMLALPLLALGTITMLRWPWLGVALLIISVPVQQVGAFGGGAVTMTRASMLVASAGLLLWWTIHKRPLVGSVLIWPFLGLMGWMVVTAHFATDVRASSSDVLRWSIAFFAFFAALQVLVRSSEQMITAMIVAIAVAGAVEAAIGSVFGLLGFGPASFAIEDAFSRASGTFGRPNTFAGYLEMAFFPVLWFGFYRLGRCFDSLREYISVRNNGFVSSGQERRVLLVNVVLAAVLLGSAAVMLSGILISFSRGAWLGMTAGLGVTSLLAVRRYWRIVVPAAPLLLLVGIVLLTTVAPAAMTNRLLSITDEARPFDASAIKITDENFAIVERMAHWQAGWRMFEDHPLTGVGARNFNVRYPDYFIREEFRVTQGHAHNFYIHMLAENGIVGLAIYLVLILGFLLVALRVALTSTDRLATALALGSLGTMAAVYVHNVFENLHVLNLGIQLSVAWAMAISAYGLARQSERVAMASNMEYSCK